MKTFGFFLMHCIGKMLKEYHPYFEKQVGPELENVAKCDVVDMRAADSGFVMVIRFVDGKEYIIHIMTPKPPKPLASLAKAAQDMGLLQPKPLEEKLLMYSDFEKQCKQ